MKKLSVLDTADKIYATSHIGPEVVLLGMQHLTPTTVELFKRLIKKGFNPSNIYLMGKCYSANPINFHKLAEMGINMSERSFYFNSHESYDQTLKEGVFEFFKSAVAQIDFSKCKKVILLDDGASLLSAASQLLPATVEVVGVEQTSAGYHIAKKLNLPFSVVNVARSKTKLHYETPFICRMLCRKVKEHMETIDFKIENILIVGSGYIGKGIYNYLNPKFKVDLFDLKDHEAAELTAEKLGKYQLIIGCAGVNSLKLEVLKKIKHKVALISASSSDREFPALELRSQLPKYHYFSQNIEVGNIHLINSGFPVNFDDRFLDSSELELTRSLLFMAIMQASQKKYARVSHFETVNHQDQILEKYLQVYSPQSCDPTCYLKKMSEISFPAASQLLRALSFYAFPSPC